MAWFGAAGAMGILFGVVYYAFQYITSAPERPSSGYIRPSREIAAASSSSRRPPPPPPTSSRRTTEEYKNDCPICLCSVSPGEEAVLNCGHRLHAVCAVQTSYSGVQDCPLCREPLNTRNSSRSVGTACQTRCTENLVERPVNRQSATSTVDGAANAQRSGCSVERPVGRSDDPPRTVRKSVDSSDTPRTVRKSVDSSDTQTSGKSIEQPASRPTAPQRKQPTGGSRGLCQACHEDVDFEEEVIMSCEHRLHAACLVTGRGVCPVCSPLRQIEGDNSCAICRDFVLPDENTDLTCGHQLHAVCAVAAFDMNVRGCPLCQEAEEIDGHSETSTERAVSEPDETQPSPSTAEPTQDKAQRTSPEEDDRLRNLLLALLMQNRDAQQQGSTGMEEPDDDLPVRTRQRQQHSNPRSDRNSISSEPVRRLSEDCELLLPGLASSVRSGQQSNPQERQQPLSQDLGAQLYPDLTPLSREQFISFMDQPPLMRSSQAPLYPDLNSETHVRDARQKFLRDVENGVRNRRAPNQSDTRAEAVSGSDVMQGNLGPESWDVCCNCLEPLSTSSTRVSFKNCSHQIHTSCVISIVKNSPTKALNCPVCRRSQ